MPFLLCCIYFGESRVTRKWLRVVDWPVIKLRLRLLVRFFWLREGHHVSTVDSGETFLFSSNLLFRPISRPISCCFLSVLLPVLERSSILVMFLYCMLRSSVVPPLVVVVLLDLEIHSRLCMKSITRWRVRVVRSDVECQSQQLDTIMYSLHSCSLLNLDLCGILYQIS